MRGVYRYFKISMPGGFVPTLNTSYGAGAFQDRTIKVCVAFLTCTFSEEDPALVPSRDWDPKWSP